MKNKINIILTILLFFLISSKFEPVSANEILIDAQKIDITENGKVILASGDVNITDGNLEIKGNKAKFDKPNQNLEIYGNVTFFDKIKNLNGTSNKVFFDKNKNILSATGDVNITDGNLEIKGNKAKFDKPNQNLEIYGNVILKDNINNYVIFCEKIILNNSNQIIRSIGNTEINYKNQFLIVTKDIVFDKKKNIFSAKENTLIEDQFENKFQLSSFNFNLKNKILKAKKIILSDLENNTLKVENGFVDLNKNELVGSDFNFNFNKDFFGNSENDPRLIGRYIITNKSESTMKKSSFTTCKNVEGKCPSWSISANEVKHKKEKKRIEYKNAWLKVHDMPIAYFPYFFHPDPTVERQSGFLFPQFINNSNLGFSTQIPYFKAIDIDKDMTISPRVYTNNNLFIQTEYRQQFKNSNLISDFSYNKKDNSNSHFFSSFISDFQDSFLIMKLETVSNKDYLKKYQIQSPLVESYHTLNSSVLFEKYTDDYSFSSSFTVIEDLEKNSSDSFEYIFPNYEFSKETFFNDNFFDTLNFNSSGNYRKHKTNVDEIDVVNDFIFTSNSKFLLNKIDTDFNILLKNINTYGDLSDSYKENEDYKLLGSAILNLKYPLFKSSNNTKKYLTPIASFRYSPNSGLNLNETKTLIKFEDLFNVNRIDNKTVEKGASATIGMEYKKINKFESEDLKFGLAVNFRNSIDQDLPISSSLGEKTSDIIGYSGVNITENLSFEYNFSIDENLSETNYSLISANYAGSKFKTSFEYMEKSQPIGDDSYLTNVTEIEINKSNSLAFETSKNLDKDLTNYYNLIYEYKNDCLQASIIYNKQFYDGDSVDSGRNIFFKISFVPFGTVNTPNLND